MTGNNSKAEGNFKDLMATISAVLGFCVALVSFVLNLQELAQDPQTFRTASIVGFILCLLGTLWFVFKAKNVNSSWRWFILGGFYIFSCLYSIWVGSWLVVPAPTPVVIDTMDSVTLWSTYLDDKGSSIMVDRVTEKKTNVMKLSYTVKKDGYAAVYREINSEILAGTKAIGFSFRGSGAPNTIELKLMYKPEDNGKSAVFSVLWNHSTDVQNWTSLMAPYNLFVCWTATGCKPGEALDPSRVWRIDIAISSKDGDTPGSGIVIVDDVQGIQ